MNTSTDRLATARPWRDVELAPEIMSIPTMLSQQELGLLYWLGREYWSGGRIVDAGCFLGGSTMALATGVRDSGAQIATPPIIAYDRFRVERYALEDGFFADADIGVDDDFAALFERNVKEVRQLLDVRSGDIAEQRWEGAPIEIMFLDLLKSWPINDYFVREFWPALVPERAIVVQQDYLWGGYPWLAITMELLSDYFEPLDEMPWATAVFRLIRPLPDLRSIALSRELAAADKLALMNRAIDREREPLRAAMLRLSRVLLLQYLGRFRAAKAEVNRVLLQYGGEPSITIAARVVSSPPDDIAIEIEGPHHDPLMRAMRSLAV